MNSPRQPASANTPRRIGWLAGVAVCLILLGTLWPGTFPPMGTQLTLRVTFPAGIAGQAEPLITTGIQGGGDLLAVRYTDERTATIVYDVWGMGGSTSQPFELQAGTPRTLEIEMPTLAPVAEFKSREKRPLRVAIDGREIMNQAEFFHLRRPEEISFARNAIGGTVAAQEFRGELVTRDGRRLHGGPDMLFTWRERLPWLFAQNPGRIFLYLLLSVAAGFVAQKAAGWMARNPLPKLPARIFVGRPQPAHGWFLATAFGCALVFSHLVTAGTYEFFVEESFGIFYDHQAQSMLRGRFDVPESAIGGEAFVVEGKNYGYFGITPSLLRLPFVMIGSLFGELSRVFLLGYFLLCLAGAYALLCHATRILNRKPAWPSPWALAVLMIGGVLGTTLLFLGSRAYIYHEAILCGAAFALWCSFFALRYLENSAGKAWLGALLCGLGAIHARPSSGLYALCLLGVVALVHLYAHWKNRSGSGALRHVGIGLGATAAILSFNGVSYLKFKTFDGSPLRYSVQYTPGRIAKFDGKNFHRSNLRHNLDTYLLRPDFHLKPQFPFFHIGTLHPRAYPEAKIDLEEPALAFPYAMPCLFALAVAGGAWVLLWAPGARQSLLVLGLGVAPMALALGMAVVTSHRYTGDFCPFLIACAAWGTAALDGERTRRVWLGLASALTVLSMLITLAIALRFQGEMVWGVPEATKVRYRELGRQVNDFFGVKPP